MTSAGAAINVYYYVFVNLNNMLTSVRVPAYYACMSTAHFL
jgi:hypothetical protein